MVQDLFILILICLKTGKENLDHERQSRNMMTKQKQEDGYIPYQSITRLSALLEQLTALTIFSAFERNQGVYCLDSKQCLLNNALIFPAP